MNARPSAIGLRWLGLALLAIALTALVLLARTHRSVAQVSPRTIAPRGALFPAEQALIDMFERSRGSVVYITTQARVIDPWTRNVFNMPRGTGSGFVWDSQGHVVTNNHVVEGASGARIRLSDGRDAGADLIGVSPAHDLAVLKVDVSNPPPALPIGSSHDLRVGQTTVAIGNPFGLDWTLTTGIISALDRSLPAENGRTLVEHLIQTDAAINPGNSGGPLLDSAGRLIGVNTAIFSPSGASAGVGFAVPVDTVNRVVPELIGRGKYVRPALGIEVDEGLNRIVMRRLRAEGVAVLRVTPGSAAEAAGLRGARSDRDGNIEAGDVIVSVDGRAVNSVARLLGALDDYRAGDTVRLGVLRDGRTVDVTVSLQEGNR